MVLGRHRHRPHPALHVADHRVDVATADPGVDVDVPGGPEVLELLGEGHETHRGDVTETHLATRRDVDAQVGEVGGGAPRLGGAPDHDVEDPLVLVEVAHQGAGEIGGRGAPDVTRDQPVLLRRDQVGLDLEGRLLGLRDHPGLDHAGDRRDLQGDPLRSAVHGVEIGALDPHRQVAAAVGVRRDGVDPVLVVVVDRGLEPGEPADDALHRREGAGVVGRAGEAHPHVGGVHIDRLVGVERAAHVGAHVLDARELAEVLARHPGDAVHLLE